jgi:hypothetical protein
MRKESAMREDKDYGAKWLLEHHGGAALWLGGVRGFLSCRAAQTELTYPLQRPDGLLEVTFPGQTQPDLYLIEVSTYPEERAEVQAFRNALLIALDRRVIPEVIVLVLHPRGNLTVGNSRQESSRSGHTRVGVSWTVVPVSQLSAEALLAANDVGLVPWVPLTQTTLPAADLLQRCREQIDRLATPAEHGNLLAVTQILAGLRYNDPALLTILGGKLHMIQSPVLIEVLEEREREVAQRYVLQVLTSRFGSVPEALAAQVRSVQSLELLEQLHRFAAVCPDVEAFRAHLAAHQAAGPPNGPGQ